MIKYTNIDTIFTKLYRDYKLVEISESDIVEWSAEALAAIGAKPNNQSVTKFFHVDNYQIILPYDLININQLILLHNETNNVCNCIEKLYKDNSKIDIYSIEKTVQDKESCNSLTDKKCTDIIFTQLNDNWESNYLDNYSVIRLATSTFKNSYDCTRKIGTNCNYEYTIIEGSHLRFNFTDKVIALSYDRIPTDNRGFPLIPDDYGHITAIIKYIIMKLTQFRYFQEDKFPTYKVQKAEQDWNHYCSQAAANSMIPNSIDEMQNLSEMWLKPIRGRSYYDTFTNSSREQKLKH